MDDEPPVPETEEERAEATAEISRLLYEMEDAGAYDGAIELGSTCYRAFRRAAPDDTLAAAEIAVQIGWLMHRFGDEHAAESNLMITYSNIRPELYQYEQVAVTTGQLPKDVAADGDPLDPPLEHDRKVGLAIADVNASYENPALWRLVRARRVAGLAANHLGLFYMSTTRELGKARYLLERALVLRTGRPEEVFMRAQTLDNLGKVALANDDAELALRTFHEAVTIARSIDGIERVPDFVVILTGYAQANIAVGQAEQGEALLREALELATTQAPTGSPGFARIAGVLAGELLNCGCVVEADTLLTQATSIRARMGSGLGQTAAATFELGIARWAEGNLDSATALFGKAIRELDARLAHLLELGSEEDRLAAAFQRRLYLDHIITFAVEAQTEEAARIAFGCVLRRKGIITEMLVRQRENIGDHPDAKVGDLLTQADTSRVDLARSLTAGMEAEAVAARVADIRNAEQVAGMLSRIRFEGDDDPSVIDERQAWWNRWLGADESLTGNLPPGSALVEYVSYLDMTPPWHGAEACTRYAAFVVQADTRSVRLLRLGASEQIDALAADMLAALEDDGSAIEDGEKRVFEWSAGHQIGEQLRVDVLDPVIAVAEDARILILAPDGKLSTVPFAVLPLGEGFVVDRYDVGYVTSGRDVIQTSRPMAAATRALVLADPDVNAGVTHPPEEGFDRLPGTRDEGTAVARLLGVEPLLDAAASEEALRGAHSPVILHVATHGWYLPETAGGPEPEWAQHPRLVALRDGGFRTWGARSGLVLAGFNAAWTGADMPAQLGDGLLTADEAAMLDLAGTELVTLSACETGRGQPIALEGVYGLRKAFMQAGTRAVLSTQWKVPDAPSRVFAEHLYRRLLAGASRASALAGAQRATRERYPHPHSWGAFVLYGDPGSLPDTALTTLRAAAPDRQGSADFERHLAFEAWQAGEHDAALRVLRKHSDGGDLRSTVLMAILLGEAGMADAAEALLRPPAEHGYTPAANALGNSLAKRGDPTAAERWWRMAFDRGDYLCAQSLAAALRRRGEIDDAQRVWRAAAEHGDEDSLYAMGNEAHIDARAQEAESWWRRAAEAGDWRAAHQLAAAAERRGNNDDAAGWWRRAADLGDADAALMLGEHAYKEGRVDEAISIWRPAARAGNPVCSHNLGVALQDHGRPGADGWWRLAADQGFASSANRLALLLRARSDIAGAQHYWRIAADNGHPNAPVLLGRCLLDLGDVEGAAEWLEPRADSGDPNAMYGWGLVLRHRGDKRRAEEFLRKASTGGQPEATFALAELALADDDQVRAAELLDQAARAGVAQATGMLGDIAYSYGDVETAREYWRQAAEGDHDTSITHLAASLQRDGATTDALHILEPAIARGDEQAVALGRLLRQDPARREEWAAQGHIHALRDLAMLANANGDAMSLRRYAGAAADAGDTSMLLVAVGAAEATGAGADADRWLRKAAELGDATAADRLAARAAETGSRAQEVIWRWRARRLELAANELQAAFRASDQASTEKHLRRAASAGSMEAAQRLASLLITTDSDEAPRWLRRLAESGNPLSATQLGALLIAQGQEEEGAAQWKRARHLARHR